MKAERQVDGYAGANGNAVFHGRMGKSGGVEGSATSDGVGVI